MSLLLNMLSRLVITFLPRSKRLLISWLQSPSAVLLEPPKVKSDTVSPVSPSISHEVMGSSIKQIEAPYVFDCDNAIALYTMQGNRASSRREGKVSWVFSSCGRNLGYILELERGCPFETLVFSLKSGTCLGMSKRRPTQCKVVLLKGQEIPFEPL